MTDLDDWVARIRARIAVEETRRAGLLGALDRAAQRRWLIEKAIAAALLAAVALTCLGYALGKGTR